MLNYQRNLISIYGPDCKMYYLDDDMQQCITYLSPLEAFIIYDDSIVRKAFIFIRYYKIIKMLNVGHGLMIQLFNTFIKTDRMFSMTMNIFMVLMVCR